MFASFLQRPTVKGNSRSKLSGFQMVPLIYFFKTMFYHKQCKYAMNIGITQIRGALL